MSRTQPEAKELEKQIVYIATSISMGGYDASHLNKKMDEVIEEVKETTFTYQAISTHPDLKMHLSTFTSYAKRNKSKVISSLEDVKGELSTVQPNDRFILWQLNQLLKTAFFTNKLQAKMQLETVSRSKSEPQTEILGV